jgi:hypothetical protein
MGVNGKRGPGRPKKQAKTCNSVFPTDHGVQRCDRPASAKGFCWTHYQRFLRGGNPNAPIKKRDVDGLVAVTKTMVPIDVKEDLEQYRKEMGFESEYEALKQLLEAWHESRVKSGMFRKARTSGEDRREEMVPRILPI